MEISDDEYYDIKQNLINTLAPQLGIEPEKELRKTEIKDKNGTIHDLEKLVKKQCIVDTGEHIFMPVFDARENDKYWITPNGFTCSTRDLAQRIRIDEFVENPNLNVTIHEFRDMRTQRTVFYL